MFPTQENKDFRNSKNFLIFEASSILFLYQLVSYMKHCVKTMKSCTVSEWLQNLNIFIVTMHEIFKNKVIELLG